MNASDTVLSDDKIDKIIGITVREPVEAYEVVMQPLRALAEKQAKETWPLAQAECAETHFKPDWLIKAKYFKNATEEGRIAGRREVMEWLFSKSTAQEVDFPPTIISFTMQYEEWQAQLKAWGIEEVKDDKLGRYDDYYL